MICIPLPSASALRGAACILGAVLTVACGNDSPTSPGTPTPPPSTGSQFFTGGASLSIGADEEFCTAKTPAWGFFGLRVTAPVVVTPDGGEWVARPDSARYGDVEIRLALNGPDADEMRMTGTIRGTAIDLFSLISFPNPERVAVTDGSAGLLTGVYHTQLRAAFGS